MNLKSPPISLAISKNYPNYQIIFRKKLICCKTVNLLIKSQILIHTYIYIILVNKFQLLFLNCYQLFNY